MSFPAHWRPNLTGPWPLFTAAGETRAAHEAGPDRDWTWTARLGAPVALPSVCPHRGMPLAGCRVEEGVALCPYHGLRVAALPGEPMFRACGFDWAGQPNAAIALLAEQSREQPWMMEVFQLQGHSSAPLILCLENFLDATHTAHVHPKMVRQAGREKSIQATGRTKNWGFEIEYQEAGVQSGWLGRFGEPPRSKSFGRYLHPFAAQVDYVGLDGKSYFRATAFMRPDSQGTKVHVVVESRLWRMGLGPLRPLHWLTRAMFSKVVRQDIDALDRSWAGISAKGWGPTDLHVRSQDLAWPWLHRWLYQDPPTPDETLASEVLA